MIGTQDQWQGMLCVAGSLDTLSPSDHILKRVDKVLELSWLREIEPFHAYDKKSNFKRSEEPTRFLEVATVGFWVPPVSSTWIKSHYFRLKGCILLKSSKLFSSGRKIDLITFENIVLFFS